MSQDSSTSNSESLSYSVESDGGLSDGGGPEVLSPLVGSDGVGPEVASVADGRLEMDCPSLAGPSLAGPSLAGPSLAGPSLACLAAN